MDVFQQKTKILQYETVQKFLRDFTFQRKDYILASRSIYEAFFRGPADRASIVLYSDYGQGEPDDRMLDTMLKDVREEQPKCIIAIGGSVIDCVKLLVLEGTASAEDMLLHRRTPEKSRELIAISTTCGFGSEVSRASTCELTSLRAKLGLTVNAPYPDQTALIPEPLSKLSFFCFVTSGIDALIHASESLVSPKPDAYTRMFSVGAIRLLLHGFQVIAKEGEDARMRLLGDFMQTSDSVGIVLGNTGTDIVHALNYPLSGIHRVTHGEANYQFFTAVFQIYEVQEKYSVYDIKKLFSEALSCFMEDAFTYMETLFSMFLARKPLYEYGVKESEIKGFTDSVIESQQRLLSNSAISLSRDEVHSIHRALFWLRWNG